MTRTTAKHRGDAQRGNLNATPRRRWLGIGLVMLATLCWSTAGITITTFVRETNIEAFGLAFWRVLFSFLVLFIGMLIFKPRALRIHRRDIPWLAGMGVFAVGAFQVFWILAILNNGASIATVIQCNAPIIVTLLAWVFWREPLTWRKWAAIGLATIGTILAAGVIGAADLQITPVGLFFSLGSAATYAAFTLFTKKLTGDYNPFVILMMAFGFATLALLPFQFGRPLPTGISWLAVLAFVGLGVDHDHRGICVVHDGAAPPAGQRGGDPGHVRGALRLLLRLRRPGGAIGALADHRRWRSSAAWRCCRCDRRNDAA